MAETVDELAGLDAEERAVAELLAQIEAEGAGDAERFNPYHAPAGAAGGGQFTTASGAGSGGQGAGDPAKARRLRFEARTIRERADRLRKQLADLVRQARQQGAQHTAEVKSAKHAQVQARQQASAGRRQRANAAQSHQHRKLAQHHQAAARQHRVNAEKHAGKVRSLADRIRELRGRIQVLEGQADKLDKQAAQLSRAMAHEKVGHTGQGLWHHKGMQLPAYIQHIANDLIQERGIPESQAVQMAIGVCQRWARGGGDVTPETRAKAAAAIAEWERLKAQAKATKG